MTLDLNKKVALVTGGGRDIGRWIVYNLAKAGASVIVNYHSSKEEAEETVAEVTRFGGQAIAIQADITQAAEVNRLLAEGTEAFGGTLDILVNNAGGLLARKKLDEMDESFWDAVMAVNLKSVFLVSQAALAYMKPGGTIINLSSLAARVSP